MRNLRFKFPTVSIASLLVSPNIFEALPSSEETVLNLDKRDGFDSAWLNPASEGSSKLLVRSPKSSSDRYPPRVSESLIKGSFKLLASVKGGCKSHIVSNLNAAFCINGFDLAVSGLGLGRLKSPWALNQGNKHSHQCLKI
ncbi:hypothetical protein BY996DRAFT_6564393 [Phakopsora pachyrhizi]|nr:hypothetical protein BY996DRAFT_6564393 [Phakopsora pachyrhizi]